MMELKSCPFCGGVPGRLLDDNQRWTQVGCKSCGARATEYPDDWEKAVAAWNRRPSSDLAEAQTIIEWAERLWRADHTHGKRIERGGYDNSSRAECDQVLADFLNHFKAANFRRARAALSARREGMAVKVEPPLEDAVAHLGIEPYNVTKSEPPEAIFEHASSSPIPPERIRGLVGKMIPGAVIFADHEDHVADLRAKAEKLLTDFLKAVPCSQDAQAHRKANDI